MGWNLPALLLFDKKLSCFRDIIDGTDPTYDFTSKKAGSLVHGYRASRPSRSMHRLAGATHCASVLCVLKQKH